VDDPATAIGEAFDLIGDGPLGSNFGGFAAGDFVDS